MCSRVHESRNDMNVLVLPRHPAVGQGHVTHEDQARISEEGLEHGGTHRDNPSSSAGFIAISSACTSATSKALQLTGSSGAVFPALLLYLVSSSAW